MFWISNINNIVTLLLFTTLVALLKQHLYFSQFFNTCILINFYFFINYNLLNGLNNIHPFYFILFYFFICMPERRLFYDKKINLYIFSNFFFYIFFFLIGFILLFLGIYWASQELLWGLWWSWDPIEVYLLALVVFAIFFFHNPHIFFSYTYLQVYFFYFFYFFFISNKINLYISVHNFANYSYLDVIIYFFLFFFLFKLIICSYTYILLVILIIFQPSYAFYFILIFFSCSFFVYKLFIFNFFNFFNFIYLFFSRSRLLKFNFLHSCFIFLMCLVIMDSAEFFFNYYFIFCMLNLNFFLINYSINYIFSIEYCVHVFYENLLIFTLLFFKCICITQFVYSFFIFFYFFLLLPFFLIFIFLVKIKIRKLVLL